MQITHNPQHLQRQPSLFVGSSLSNCRRRLPMIKYLTLRFIEHAIASEIKKKGEQKSQGKNNDQKISFSTSFFFILPLQYKSMTAVMRWLLFQHLAVATNLGHIYYPREEHTKGGCSMQIVWSTLLQCTTSTITKEEEEEVFIGHTTSTTHSRVAAGS